MESGFYDFSENVQENLDGKVVEVDNLSTNLCKQMDREKEELEEETTSIVSVDELQLHPELQTGYKILIDLMSDSKKAVNWPFMESVETSAPDLFEEYKKRIEKPMWLKLMKQKFEDRQYETITEFVADFRVMLENCYRFNGPDHYISRRGQKLETMLEQKLNLLSREMREKTSIEATSGLKADDGAGGLGLRRRPKSIVPHDSTLLLNQLREAEQQKVKENRRQQMLDRKAEKEALAQEILDWEDKVLFCGKYRQQMKAMWELPQIGLFLFLCQRPLNIGEVMHYELERCFLMPRESSTMQLVMMSLLSTPFQRLKIDRKYLMPYKVWEQKLKVKVQNWYKVFADCSQDVEKACMKLGFDERFFEVVGKKNPLEKKKYHELSYYRRVWIVKGLCDHLMQTQESLRETIELQPFPDQREYVLGTDAEGQRYIHFPQFCGADLRIYRQAPFKYPKIEIKPDPFNNKRKYPFVYKPPPVKKVKLKKKKKQNPEKISPVQSPQRSRPSRLRQTPRSVVPLKYGDNSDNSNSSSDDEDTNNETNTELEDSVEKEDGESDRNDLSSADVDTKSEDRLSSGSDATIPYCDRSGSNSTQSSRDCSRESSPYQTPSDLQLGLRCSSKLDKSSDASREASPLIDDSDFGLRRSGRNRNRFKNIPPLRATRDLTSFLFDENSTTSNSSAFGENSNSGIWRNRILQHENSVSSDTGEESNSCDIHSLFTTSNLARRKANESETDSVYKSLSTDENTSFKEVTATANSAETKTTNVKQETIENDSEMLNGNGKGSERTRHSNSAELVGNVDESSVDNYEDNDKIDQLIHESVKSGINDNQAFDTLKVGAKQTYFGNLDHSENNDSLEKDIGMKVTCEYSSANNIIDCESLKVEKENKEMDTDNVDVRMPVNDTGRCDPFGMSESASCIQDCKELEANTVETKCEFADKNNVSNEKPSHDKTKSKCDIDTRSHGSSHSSDWATCETALSIPQTNPDTNSHQHSVEHTADQPKSSEQSLYVDNCRKDMASGQISVKQEVDEIKSEEIHQTLLNVTYNGEGIKQEPMDVTEEDEIKSHYTIDSKADMTVVKADGKVKDEEHENSRPDMETGTDIVKSESNVDIKVEQNDEFDSSYHERNENGDEKVKTDATVKIKTEPLEEEENDSKVEDIKKEQECIKDEEESEEDEEDEQLPDAREFELLADSVEALRNLTSEFAEQEPIIIKRGKKEQVTRPPPRKRNVVILHERLEYLLKELEPWEFKLAQATKRARLRLRKEKESYVEPPQEEEIKWNTTDEETESGDSDDEETENKDGDKIAKDEAKKRIWPEKVLSANNSRSSTPVKLEEPEEIDISQRGRLRKRRIIPNNVEDQYTVKKTRSLVKTEPTTVTSDSTPSTSQPVIIQSGKSQLVEYSDILRQIRNASSGGVTGMNPILIKTTQGGRTVLTSVLPIVSGSGAGNPASVQGLQNIQFLSPEAISTQAVGQQPMRLTVPLGAGLASTKVSQHPTIQTLLSTTSAPGIRVVPPGNTTTSSVLQLLTQTSTKGVGAVAGGLQAGSLPTGAQIVMKSQSPALSQTILMQQPSTSQKVVLQGQTTPQKVVLPQQTTPQKVALQGHITSPKNVSDVQVIPRKIAPHTSAPTDTTSKGKVKYYAANASTLPINVVQQLLATRGAKLQTGPNQQSILFIPMESEGQTRNVTNVQKTIVPPVRQQILSPVKTISTDRTDVGSQQNDGNSTDNAQTSAKSMTQSKLLNSITNTPILPKPLTGVPVTQVVNLASGVQLQATGNLPTGTQGGSQTNLVRVSKTVRLPDGSISLNVLAKNILPPTSPPRYPTNETVRNLLDKRKSGEEKVPPPTTYPCIASQLQGIAPVPLNSSVILKGISPSSSSENKPVSSNVSPSNQSVLSKMMVPLAPSEVSNFEAGKALDEISVASTSQQQCVITSISPAKLNTLLLQTSAAGAKTIPSLIKLPSKAVLDSAVKAVVTSVNTSLPTVNIKVPSPTSLPSIGPRRNVTKTIQTMKSPIPVAPKVVTQNSGITTLSVANSNTTVLSSQSVALASGKAAVTTSSPVTHQTIVQNIDGKKVLAKVAPQTVLTSKGVVQMGYLTPQRMVIPQTNAASQSTSALLNHIGLQQGDAGNQALQGMQLVQNSAGQLQLVPRTSPLLQHISQKPGLLQISVTTPQNTLNAASLQSIKPVGAVASTVGSVLATQPVQDTLPTHVTHSTSPVLLPKSTAFYSATPIKSPIMGMPSSKSPVLSVPIPLKSPVLRGSVESKSPIPAVGAGFVLPQSGSGVLTPAQSPATSQAPVSPLLNMQQNVILQGGGLQLAAPVINQLGLLQQGVALQSPTVLPNTQNLNLLQNSLGSPALQQMVNVNPLLLNNLVASSAGMMINRPTISAAGKGTNHVASVPQAGHITKPNLVFQANASSFLSGAAKQVANLANRVPATDMNLGTQGTVTTMNTMPRTESIAKQLVFQYNIPNQRLGSTAITQTQGLTPLKVVKKNLNTSFSNVNVDAKKPAESMVHIQDSVAQIARTPNTAVGQVSNHNYTTPNQPGTNTITSEASAKTSPGHQKLLLFSIGGQLVTGQGVPVTLSDGVLKLMPQGKIQIANQTLTPAQIQQTLAKINQGLNVTQPGGAGQQPQQTVSPAVKPAVVNSSVLSIVTSPSPVVQYKDHDYQHKEKVQPVSTPSFSSSITSLAVSSTESINESVKTDINTASIGLPKASQSPVDDGRAQSGSDGKAKSGVPMYVMPRSNNTQYVMKPMVYSSGYIVCPRTEKDKESGSSQVVTEMNKAHEGLQKNRAVYGNEKDRFVQQSVMVEVNGKADSKLDNVCAEGEMEVDEEESERNLVIDDTMNEKEAALNLLTLANQALAPVKIQSDTLVNKSGDAPEDNGGR